MAYEANQTGPDDSVLGCVLDVLGCVGICQHMSGYVGMHWHAFDRVENVQERYTAFFLIVNSCRRFS